MARNSTPQDQVVVIPAQTPKREKSKWKFWKKDEVKVVLSERDAEILAQVKRRAKILDTGLSFGCGRVGLDPILGLVPFAGDLITLLLAMRLIYTAQKANIPKWLTQKMVFNVAIDFAMGMVPILGDIGDFFFKANDRNAKLFEAYLYERAAAAADKEVVTEQANVQIPPPPPVRGHTGAGTGSNVAVNQSYNTKHQQYQDKPIYGDQTVIEMGSVQHSGKY
ncbi:hypothetical protein BGZ99_000576 [Dissophora globulifera]|uniref:Ph domain-containing protein n=1 Tax=Dissophora globulifera TaxID=979702 RepID=A0A9P6RTM1_9FUNG|nr:hypothetical protein BGZ99_000576 [Dissophora globulifera]